MHPVNLYTYHHPHPSSSSSRLIQLIPSHSHPIHHCPHHILIIIIIIILPHPHQSLLMQPIAVFKGKFMHFFFISFLDGLDGIIFKMAAFFKMAAIMLSYGVVQTLYVIHFSCCSSNVICKSFRYFPISFDNCCVIFHLWLWHNILQGCL